MNYFPKCHENLELYGILKIFPQESHHIDSFQLTFTLSNDEIDDLMTSVKLYENQLLFLGL